MKLQLELQVFLTLKGKYYILAVLEDMLKLKYLFIPSRLGSRVGDAAKLPTRKVRAPQGRVLGNTQWG